jgi:hypothetical protein
MHTTCGEIEATNIRKKSYAKKLLSSLLSLLLLLLVIVVDAF